MKMIKILLATIVTASVVSCKSNSTTSQPEVTVVEQTTTTIKDQYWKLTELMGKPVQQMGKEPFITLQSENNRFSASAGCNTLMGSYTLDESVNRVKFSTVASTQMACTDMENEQILKKVLESVDNYTISNGVLSLNKARMAPMAKFVLVDKSSAKLKGEWEANYISGPRIVFEKLFPNAKPTINFDTEKNIVNGYGGCNQYNGKITLEGNNLKFGPLASTKKLCEGNGETLFLQGLEKVDNFSISTDGKTLELFSGKALIVKLIKK